MKTSITTDIAIVGAGISGLSAAFALKEKGASVSVLEKKQMIGGTIHSERQNGFLVEWGPNSTLETSPLPKELFQKLGIIDSQIYAGSQARNRYIIRKGKLLPLPMSPPAFLKSSLFPFLSKLNLLKEPFIAPAPPEKEESLADFVRRRLGNQFLDYAINPFVAGIYAGSPETLSVKSAFPKLYELEQQYGSLIKGTILGARKRRKRKEIAKPKAQMFSFKEGMQTLIQGLESQLPGQIHSSAAISLIRYKKNDIKIDFYRQKKLYHLTAKALLLCIPACDYPSLSFESDFSITKPLAEIYYPPVTMVYFGFQKIPPAVNLDGFGFLVPEKEQRQILGTLFNSSIFPNRAPQQGIALTTFVGGSRQPENALLPDDQLIQIVRKDHRELLGIADKPDQITIKRWEKAIPQYQIGHQNIIEKIEQFEKKHPGIFISGNFRGGISVDACIQQSYKISDQIYAYLQKNKKNT